MTAERQEYEAALAVYATAKERLIEAKRHYDPKTEPEFIERRNARARASRAKRIAENQAWLASPEQQASEERFRRMVEEYNRRGIAT